MTSVTKSDHWWFCKRFSEIYLEMQVILHVWGYETELSCLLHTVQNFLALYEGFGAIQCISFCCALSYCDNTESLPKINTGGEAHDRPAHPLHKCSEVAPEELHQRLIWPLMFKKVHAKYCRAEEKQH